jgi:hypothetical protein
MDHLHLVLHICPRLMGDGRSNCCPSNCVTFCVIVMAYVMKDALDQNLGKAFGLRPGLFGSHLLLSATI